ncbi:MAG TPA: hypothetical protein VJP77_04890 [Planctomycetota bacterium]|nr:hypothetical protein [Planctomycetota bacterium]
MQARPHAHRQEPRVGRPRSSRLDEAIADAIYRRWPSKSERVTHAVFRKAGDDGVADTGGLVAAQPREVARR